MEYSSLFVFDYYNDDDVGEVKSFVVFPSGEENTFLLQVVPGVLLFSRREKIIQIRQRKRVTTNDEAFSSSASSIHTKQRSRNLNVKEVDPPADGKRRTPEEEEKETKK